MNYTEMLMKVYELALHYGVNFIAAIAIFFLGKWIVAIVTGIIEKLMVKANVEETLVSFVKNLSYYMLLAVVIVAALNKMGVQTTSIVAVIGAATLAIGLALQGSLANFAAGVMIIIFHPFKVGDFVEAGGTSGIIKEVQIFNTIMTTPDNKKIIMPNSKITTDKITNYSDSSERRVDLVFGISYDDDIKLAKEVLNKMVSSDPRILSEPAPQIAVSELGDSSVNLVCRPWVKPDVYWDVYFDLLERGKIELEANGLSIPYPQRDIHVLKDLNK